MSNPYAISTSLGSAGFGGTYVNTPVKGPLNTNQYPFTMAYHNYGTLVGQRPTPPQFYPGQEPVNYDMNVNMRKQYLATALTKKQEAIDRAIAKLSAPFAYVVKSTQKQTPISTHMNYIQPIPSSMYNNQLKAVAIGKSAYKVGLPLEAPISSKSYDTSLRRSALQRARSGGSCAPKKKGSIYNTSLRSPGINGWGSLPRTGY